METENRLDERYYQMLEQLQTLDFALVELSLYLDTHPTDANALKQFNQLAQERMQCAYQFEQAYGPLMQFGHSFSKYPWQWVESPWPWQV